MRFLTLILCFGLIFGMTATVSKAAVEDWLPEEISSPLLLSLWMQENLEYIAEEKDVWKTPEQTVADGGGDCEDFAILTKHVFEHWGIEEGRLAVVILKEEKDRRVGHMIYVWRMPSGDYWHMSNQYIIPSGKQKMMDMLDYYYPEWIEFAWVAENKLLFGFATWYKRGE